MVRPPRSFCLLLLHDTRFDSIFGLLDAQGPLIFPSSPASLSRLGPDALDRVLETSFSASSAANTSFGIHSRAETAADRYRDEEKGGGGRKERNRALLLASPRGGGQIAANRFISCNRRGPYVSLSLFLSLINWEI